MDATSPTLLHRLRTDAQEADWQSFLTLYTPLIHHWINRFQVPPGDRNDVAQEVLAVVVRKLPRFEHNQRKGAFRNWLRLITFHCLKEYWRTNSTRPKAVGGSDFMTSLTSLEDPASELSQIWDREHDLFITQTLLDQIRSNFTDNTWQAFRRLTVDGLSADEVARELGVSVNAVFIAKSRVMAKLRKEVGEFLD